MKKETEYQNSLLMPIRILHVDDEPADLEITKVFLKRAGKDDFEIVGALSAGEALQKLEREHFDVVIADYKMPKMDGLEFLEAVRKSEAHAHIPFILFTGKGGPEVTKEAFNKGANRYITKAGDTTKQCYELALAVRELASAGKREEGEDDKKKRVFTKRA